MLNVGNIFLVALMEFGNWIAFAIYNQELGSIYLQLRMHTLQIFFQKDS